MDKGEKRQERWYPGPTRGNVHCLDHTYFIISTPSKEELKCHHDKLDVNYSESAIQPPGPSTLSTWAVGLEGPPCPACARTCSGFQPCQCCPETYQAPWPRTHTTQPCHCYQAPWPRTHITQPCHCYQAPWPRTYIHYERQ